MSDDAPPIVKTGSTECSACNHPDHDRLCWDFWRGCITAAEAGKVFGLGGDSFTMHIRRHIPNHQLLRYTAKAVGSGDALRLLTELRVEADRAADPFQRVFLVRQNIRVLRGQLLAHTDGGFRDDVNTTHAIRALAAELDKQGRALMQAEREAVELAHLLKSDGKGQGEGWDQLREFQHAVAEALEGYPDAWRAILEQYRKDTGSDVELEPSEA